jgi:hypothetical protein
MAIVVSLTTLHIYESLLRQLLSKFIPPVVSLLPMRLDDLMQSVNFTLLGPEHLFRLTFLHVEGTKLLLELGLGCVVFIFHGKNILIDWDLIFQEVIQFVDSFPLHDLFVLQQFEFVLQIFYLFLKTLQSKKKIR